VEKLVDLRPNAQIVLLNPNLGMSGASLGIRERDRRQAFLDSFESAYTFRVLATFSRPQLVPRELGALQHTFGGKFRLLRCLLPGGNDGPGSLNRFMKRRIYEQVRGPTARSGPPP
jgi:hypothetical protein